MDANLQNDFTVISGFLEKLMQTIESAGAQDVRSRLAEELLRHYKYRKTLEFRTIPAQYAKEVLGTLERNNVPHIASRNSAGDTVLILPPEADSHIKYEHLINDVFMHYPEYYKQLSAPTWTRLARMDGENGVIGFTFPNSLDAEIFKNKIYADGTGTVTTDQIHADGSTTVYCRQSDFINNRARKDAVSAFIDTEYSLDKSNQAFARRLAVWHDRQQADECMRLMESGEAFVIHDGANKYSDYLQYEDGILTYNHYDSELKKFSTKEVDVTREDKDAMRKLFEYHVAHIHNEHISTLEEFQRDFEQHTENFVRDRYVDKQKDMYTKVIMPAMEFVSANSEAGLCEQDLFEQIVNSDPFTQSVKQNRLEDIRPDFSIDFLEALMDDFKQQRQELQEDLAQMVAAAKEEHEQFGSMLSDRAVSLKRSFLASGMHTIGGRPIEQITIPALQQELTHKVRRQEAKLREACGFGTRPSGNAKELLRSFYNRGIPIAHLETAQPLLAKKELTKEETDLLGQIADDTLFDMCAREDSTIALQLKDYYASRAKLREVDDLLADCSKLSEARDHDHKENMRLITHQRELLKASDRQISNMEKLIHSEKQRVTDIEKLDKKVHEQINRYKSAHPSADLNAVLGEVHRILKQEGITDIHGRAACQSFASFEKEVQARYADQTQISHEFEDVQKEV